MTKSDINKKAMVEAMEVALVEVVAVWVVYQQVLTNRL